MRENISLELASTQVIGSAKIEWVSYLDEHDDLPDVPYKRIIAWADDFANNRNIQSNTFVYALVSDDDEMPKVLALMDVTYKLPQIQNQFCIKILGIYTAPHFDLRQENTETSNQFTRKQSLSFIVSHIMASGLQLARQKEAVEMKIFASNQVTLDIFESIDTSSYNELLRQADISVDNQKNWLVFSLQ